MQNSQRQDILFKKLNSALPTLKSTVKPVLYGHSKVDKTKVLKIDGRSMHVESIAECSNEINADRKYCRMLPLEHSAILLTCIK